MGPIAKSFLDRTFPSQPNPATEVVAVRSVAAPLVLDHAWHHLTLDRLFDAGPDESVRALERAAFAIVAHHMLAGQSTAGVAEWTRKDAVIPGLEGPTADLWSSTTHLLGDPAVRDELEKLARARVRPMTLLYLAKNLSASDAEFALALDDECWPALVRAWPAQDDPQTLPLYWAKQLSDEMEVTAVLIQPRPGAAPEHARLRSSSLRPDVSYGKSPGGTAGSTRSIFVRIHDSNRPGHVVDHMIDVTGRVPSDERVACAYLDSLPVRQEFADLLARPLPALPPEESDRAARARALVAWIALLLARQVEQDTNLTWPEARTELLRVQDVTLRQAGRTRDLRTRLSPTQQRILSSGSS